MTDEAAEQTGVPRAATETYVRRALELAREAGERGDDPYGSLLVDPAAEGAATGDGSAIVMEERNAVHTDDDIARHPELTLARRAGSELDPAVRERAIMYTSTEPCPMCAGGIAIARLAAVVHSVPAGTSGSAPLASQAVYDGGEVDVASYGPVLESEGRAVHEEFR